MILGSHSIIHPILLDFRVQSLQSIILQLLSEPTHDLSPMVFHHCGEIILGGLFHPTELLPPIGLLTFIPSIVFVVEEDQGILRAHQSNPAIAERTSKQRETDPMITHLAIPYQDVRIVSVIDSSYIGLVDEIYNAFDGRETVYTQLAFDFLLTHYDVDEECCSDSNNELEYKSSRNKD